MQPNSKQDRDRIRQRVASANKYNRAIADMARRTVAEYLQGRPADACMSDLLNAARSQP